MARLLKKLRCVGGRQVIMAREMLVLIECIVSPVGKGSRGMAHVKVVAAPVEGKDAPCVIEGSTEP
jgi:hypothetical protein